MPLDIQSLIRQYESSVSSGDLETACRHLQQVISMAGDQPDLLSALGTLLLLMGKPTEAEAAAWRAIAIDRNHEDTLKLLGRLRVKAGRPEPQKSLLQLPGTPYSRHLLPLEYLPSRDLRPRWGNGSPPHAGLSALFARNHGDYTRMIAELRSLVPHLGDIRTNFGADTAEAGWVGPAVNALDLAVLYYFVWKHQPATYLEIGSGATTCFARRAVNDHKIATRIVSIDPEPRASIDRICDEVIRDGLETLPSLQVFADLQPGDIVFLDGSHRCFMNSDVTVFFLDVLPLLKPGVIVHIHDIALPNDYPEWAKNWYWSEQYMLATYLLGMRDRVKVLMPAQYVCDTAGLKDCLQPPLLTGVGDPGIWLSGGSFWFTHV